MVKLNEKTRTKSLTFLKIQKKNCNNNLIYNDAQVYKRNVIEKKV